MILGIDFGTSFSQIATMYMDRPHLLLQPGEYGVPSEFYYDKEQGIMVGQDALDSAQGCAAVNLKSEVKMDLVTNFTADGKTFTPKEIISNIYRTLIEGAKYVASTEMIDPEVEGLVLSHPAAFTMQECNLIRRAAEDCLGGKKKLKVLGMIKEPVAAALSYFSTSLQDGTDVMVYDLGGGTCDIAIVRADSTQATKFKVIDSDMIRLGGRDWDRKLIDYIVEKLEKDAGISVRGDEGTMEKVRRTANSVKHRLSSFGIEQAPARVEINGRLHTVMIQKSTFDEITIDLLNQTLELLEEVYERNSDCNVKEIICVGGSSNMPQVKDGIQRQFPSSKVSVYQPEHAVINGATRFTEMLTAVADKLPFSYGVRCIENYDKNPDYYIIQNIIHSGDELPVCKSYTFHPVRNGVESVSIRIFESSVAENYPDTHPDKREVGSLELSMPYGASRSTPIICTITANDMSNLDVMAKDDKGNKIEAHFELNALTI